MFRFSKRFQKLVEVGSDGCHIGTHRGKERTKTFTLPRSSILVHEEVVMNVVSVGLHHFASSTNNEVATLPMIVLFHVGQAVVFVVQVVQRQLHEIAGNESHRNFSSLSRETRRSAA